VSGPPAADERRRLAVDLFNHVWTLLETEGRTPEQDDEMLHAAHASRYHWGAVGTDAHRARGEWQCARVYAVLGRAEPALHHARRCLALCEAGGEGFEDWDVAAALEALARAHAVGGDDEAAKAAAERARAAAEAIADAADREVILADLPALPARAEGG
jgi:hypothetical protein